MPARAPAKPLPMRPIDDAARDGRFQIVSDGAQFAVARWNGEAFVFAGIGAADIGFVAHSYYRPAHHHREARHG